VKGTLNPVGYNPELISGILNAIGEAVDSQKPATVGYISQWVKVRALGPQQSTEIISTVNASFAILKIIAPLFIIGMIGIVLIVALHI